MRPDTGNSAFAKLIRDRREQLGYSISRVAELSKHPPTAGDPISQPYLSLLESGHSAGVGLRKLFSLASILRLHTPHLISTLPEPVRSQRQAEYDQHVQRSPGWAEPPPLPDVESEFFASAIEKLLFPFARNLDMPLDAESWARPTLRRIAFVSTACPCLAQNPDFAEDIRRSEFGPLKEALRDAGNERPGYPKPLDTWIVQHPTYASWCRSQLDFWTANVREHLVTLRFKQPSTDAHWGFTGAPFALVVSLRYALLGNIIASASTRGPVYESINHFILTILNRLQYIPDDHARLASARTILAQLPELEHAPHFLPHHVEAEAVRLIREAIRIEDRLAHPATGRDHPAPPRHRCRRSAPPAARRPRAAPKRPRKPPEP